MTNNMKNINLLYFQGLIKRTAFYIKPKEDVDSDYNLDILISINLPCFDIRINNFLISVLK